MASNVTRDHHNLRRNLKLNSNYISNDGGDEGISINDDGDVSMGVTTFTSASDDVTIDKNIVSTDADATLMGLNIDIDKTAGTDNAFSLKGIRVTMDSLVQEGGLNYMYGIHLSPTFTHSVDAGAPIVAGLVSTVTGSSNGTSIGYGISQIITGSDTQVGILQTVDDGQIDLRFRSSANSNDYFQIATTAEGATTLSTVDADTAVGHLTIVPDGDLVLDPVSTKIIINATDDLFFDGGTDTYITETSADSLQIIVGGDPLAQLTNFGANGNVFHFRDASAGFSRLEATFSDTLDIGSLGTDDTTIDFRFSNKWRLEMTGDITNINLIFPSMAGNFLLVCTTNGDHDVTNWKVYEADESAATTTDVMWAGGSVPAFTSSGVDIVSFYWDNNEQQAYGVASLAFATP